LREHDTLWTEEDDIRWAKARLDRTHTRRNGLWFHDHTGTTPVRSIIRDVVAVRRKVTQIMDLDLE
jgi:hypothetical protein